MKRGVPGLWWKWPHTLSYPKQWLIVIASSVKAKLSIRNFHFLLGLGLFLPNLQSKLSLRSYHFWKRRGQTILAKSKVWSYPQEIFIFVRVEAAVLVTYEGQVVHGRKEFNFGRRGTKRPCESMTIKYLFPITMWPHRFVSQYWRGHNKMLHK